MFKKITVIILVLFVSPQAFSWGKTGHRVVAEIAQRNLSNIAKTEVKKLLGAEDLASVSTWADEMRSNKDFDFATTWHYVSIPTGKTYFDQKRNATGDVIETLFRLEETLRTKNSTKAEKVNALKFLVHMMGDLHQPLHVGIADDRGGNSIKIKWFKSETNLHALWDEGLIDFEQLSYTEYANFLNHFTGLEKKSFTTGNFLDWAKESQDLRTQVYNTGKDETVGYDYRYQVKPVLELRLRQGGLRLAKILNSIFQKESLSKDYLQLREKIKNNI